MSSKPDLVKHDYLELRRKTARGYACPFCRETYQAEPKLWSHGTQNHRSLLGDWQSTEAADVVRKQYRQQAIDKAYVIVSFGTVGMACSLPEYSPNQIFR